MGCSSTKESSLEQRKINLLIEIAETNKEITNLHLKQKNLEKQGNKNLAQIQEKEKINAIYKLYHLNNRMNEMLKYCKTEEKLKGLLKSSQDKKLTHKEQIKNLKDALKDKAKNAQSQKTILLLQQKIQDLQDQEDALTEQINQEEAENNIKADQFIDQQLVELEKLQEQQTVQSHLRKSNVENLQLPLLQYPDLKNMQFQRLPEQISLYQNPSGIKISQYV